ncbi:hypothetical protein L1887_02755 [Cichorium endivia]|nr:hypothetical protein L1887_02755 [Cichorium endivia]
MRRKTSCSCFSFFVFSLCYSLSRLSSSFRRRQTHQRQQHSSIYLSPPLSRLSFSTSVIIIAIANWTRKKQNPIHNRVFGHEGSNTTTPACSRGKV